MEYKVLEGDTLEAIAQRMGVTERAILESNKLELAKGLKPGQVITIPQPYSSFFDWAFRNLGND
jgi:LysM repeat protein